MCSDHGEKDIEVQGRAGWWVVLKGKAQSVSSEDHFSETVVSLSMTIAPMCSLHVDCTHLLEAPSQDFGGR